MNPLTAGNNVFVRTITNYYTGKVASVTDSELLLENAAWIADTGRFANALRDGTFREIEPYPDGVISISRAAVVDVCSWGHPLPREQK